ncbi:protein mono-ADP-ribosyltransferase PARP14-like [Clupea harengus]|uniref:Protein mono-ADP-ribosyltransferase PARP14-like n=1 Tax=Clupea harengus TaxID=7950 RepID=A0A8M1KLS9_CLUHA|nr:protein mono-ADP-ribosyltransferase PARP14-like [Clupea harengus]
MILILPDGKKTQSQSQDHQDEDPSASGSIEVQEERVEDSYRPNAVVVENIAEDMTRELLGLIVDNITGISEDDYSMELIYESCVAVVTFTHPDDVKKFQTEAKLSKMFQQYNLTARDLERTCCLRIEGLPLKAKEDLVSLYCEKFKVEVQSVAMKPEEKAAVVTFQKPEDVVTMLNTQHKIFKVEVSMHPYYKSLGTALYGKDRPRWKIPDSFPVSIHPALYEFLVKKQLRSHINDQMQAHFCQMSMQNTNVLLSPLPALLKMKGLTAKHIDGWKENTLDAFHHIMSKYAILEKVMNSEVCGSVAKELRLVVQDHVVMTMDSVKGQLTLAGMSRDIENLRGIVVGIIQKATDQFERETKSVSEVMDLPPDMYKLLQLDGLSQYITASCPQVSLNYKSSIKKLVLSGLRTEVLSVKTWVLENRLQMTQRAVELDRHIVDFLRAVDREVISDRLFFSKRIHAIYVIKDGAVVLTASSETSLSESMQRIKETLAFRVLTVEDQEVLRKSEWKTLNTELLSVYNTSREIRLLITSNKPDSLIIAGFIELVKEVSLNLEEFLRNHARIVDTVKVKCCAAARFIEKHKSDDWKKFAKVGEVVVKFHPRRPRINLSGERIYVKPALDAFKRMVTSLFIDELKVSKPGAKKFFQEQGSLLLSMMLRDHRCVVLLQDDDMVDEADDDEAYEGERLRQSSGLWGQVNTVSLGKHSVHIGHLTLEVSTGDITKETTDVIVNSSNGTFSLKSGVSMAILEAAGSAVESECSEIVSSPNFQPCQMIWTSSGRLPSLGTGQGGVSASAVADAMIEAIVSFVKKAKSHNIQFVKILIFQTNMVSVFHQSLLTRQAKGTEDDKGILDKMKGKKANNTENKEQLKWCAF